MSKVIGIDPSLTNTAIYYDGLSWEVKGGKLRGTERLATMYGVFCNIFANVGASVAVVEGYAYAAANSRSHRLGELGGVLRLALAKEGVNTIYEVPPSSLKKFFTGKGDASKEDMVAEATKRMGRVPPSHDVADACALWYAGADQTFLNRVATADPLVNQG